MHDHFSPALLGCERMVMKTPTYNPTLHDAVLKVRLTETDAATLRAIAKQKGLKPATLARVFLKEQIDSFTTAYPLSACSEGPKRDLENLKTASVSCNLLTNPTTTDGEDHGNVCQRPV
ncbi:hypothetical protein JKG47_18430 [Acidithiobacillus sp. MC6.1]|nr:hypothetical protein [Acidithiobacillus sp. MC6.1]